MKNAIELMLAHRSIRSFTDDPVEQEDVSKAVQCGQKAATSSFVQAYCVINVNAPAKRSQFVALSGGQRVVEEAKHFMVICGDSRRHRLLVERSGLQFDSHFEGFLLATIDATLFAQNMVIAFEAMGYGTCYIGGIRNDIPAAVKALELPEGIYPLFGLCVGKPAQDPIDRPRLPLQAVLFEDGYPADEEMLRLLDAYDQTIDSYTKQRSGKSGDWSGKIIRAFSSPQREKTAIWYQNLGATLD